MRTPFPEPGASSGGPAYAPVPDNSPIAAMVL
jgi:hypothetical protein